MNEPSQVVPSVPTERKPGKPFNDLTGQRFGRWLVRHRVIPNPPKMVGAVFECVCDCGTVRIVRGIALKGGNTVSCGCFARENMSRVAKKHGHGLIKGGKTSPTYRTWRSMKMRCLNPKDPHWIGYGGRGISICARWKDSFVNFLADVGERPDSTTLDRINVNGHYSCGNCEECTSKGWPANTRWATGVQQGNNRRNNHLLTIRGQTHTIQEWSRISGVKAITIHARVARYGYTPERAVFTTRYETRNEV